MMIPRIIDVNENGRFIAKHRGFITIKKGDEFYGEVPLDDIMEPYRPLVDYFVKQAVAADITDINPTAKQMISAFLWTDLYFDGETTPFYVAMERLAFSLVNSFKSKKPLQETAPRNRKLKLPR